MPQLLKKISRSTVFGDKADVQRIVLLDQAKDHPLYSVGGRVTQIEKVFSKFRPDADDDFSDGAPRERRAEFKLIGEFQAINQQTGEVFISPICWLPAFAASLIVGRFIEGEALEFALLIGAKYDATVATSYQFTVKPLMEDNADPSMQRIGNLLAKHSAVKALPPSDKKE